MGRHKKAATQLKYTQDQKDSVIAACKGPRQLSVRAASVEFGVPKSTISDWLVKPGGGQLLKGHPQAISVEHEELIACALVFTSQSGLPQTREHLKDMVAAFLKHANLPNNFMNGRPGHDWVIAFEDRNKHILKRHKAEKLSKSRASDRG